MTVRVGESVGRYQILELIGQGGMAAVYKAFDLRLKREVALKVILPNRLQSTKSLKRFEREARALASLAHPHIVRILDYGEHVESPYLVMEFVSGGTLREKLGEPMPWREAIGILTPIAEALEYAHGKSIIHRDVKPSNILLSDHGKPMLSDFGVAKALELEDTWDLTGTGVGVGTPNYMAPEQGLGKKADHRADVYAIGIVLFELLTGQKPYQAETPLATLLAHLNDPIPRPSKITPGVPRAIEQVTLRALAKQPSDRFQTMNEFSEALKEAVARPEGRLAQQIPVRRTLRIAVAAAGVGVLLPVALFLSGTWRPGTTNEPTGEAGAAIVVTATERREAEATADDALATQTEEERPTGSLEATATTINPTPVSLDVFELAPITAERVGDLALLAEFPGHSSPTDMVWTGGGGVLAVAEGRRVSFNFIGSPELDSGFDAPGFVTDLDAASNTNLLAARLSNGKIALWDLEGNNPMRTIDAENGEDVELLAVSPDGSVVATATDRLISLWDMESGARIRTDLRAVSTASIVVSPDGTHLAYGGIYTHSIWEIRDGYLLYDQGVRGFRNGTISILAIAPPHGNLAIGFDDGTVILKNILANGLTMGVLEHPQAVVALSYSPEGDLLAVGTAEGRVTIWRPASGTEPSAELRVLEAGFEISQRGVAFSPNGKLLAVKAGGNAIQLWGIPG